MHGVNQPQVGVQPTPVVVQQWRQHSAPLTRQMLGSWTQPNSCWGTRKTRTRCWCRWRSRCRRGRARRRGLCPGRRRPQARVGAVSVLRLGRQGGAARPTGDGPRGTPRGARGRLCRGAQRLMPREAEVVAPTGSLGLPRSAAARSICRASTWFAHARARIPCGDAGEGVPVVSEAAAPPARIGLGWSMGRKEGNWVPPQ
jgi:hypothetical protein